MKIEIRVQLSILLLATGSLLSCTDKNSQGQVPGPEQTRVLVKRSVDKANTDRSIFAKTGNEKMQVQLGEYAFTLPEGWRDTSSYIYKAKDQKRALTVSFGTTRENLSLAQLASERRQELVESMGDEVKFIAQGKGKISSLQANYLSFEFGDQDRKYQEYWATAYYAEKKWLALSYVGPGDDPFLAATFKHIVDTCLSSSGPSPEDVAPEHVWRHAHILRLQVPIMLAPPRHYTYESATGIKLKASLYLAGDNWPSTSVADAAAKDLPLGGTKGEIQSTPVGGFATEQIDYVFQGGDPLEPNLYRAYRAHVAGFGSRLFFLVKGDESQSEQIDRFWKQLMSSLEASG